MAICIFFVRLSIPLFIQHRRLRLFLLRSAAFSIPPEPDPVFQEQPPLRVLCTARKSVNQVTDGVHVLKRHI